MSADVQEAAPGQGARARGEGKEIILQLDGLSVSYGNIAAVQNLSMTVYAGEIVTLIGSNGAGKSTTLRTISGLLRPKSGDVVYEGKKINGIPGHDVVKLGISQSPEGRKIFQRMTVSENLDLGAYTRKDTAKIAEDRENVLELFPRLRERINQKAGTMSGGWRLVRTMGSSITQLRPVSGFAAETSAAVALFGSTALGAPVSTTHTVAGAVTGVGATTRGATVNWTVFGRLAIAWIVTLPAAAAVAAVAYLLTTAPPTAVSAVVMGVVLAVLVVLLFLALRSAPKASDVVPGEDEELEVPMRTGAGSVIDARGVPASREVLERGGSLAEAEAAVREQDRTRQPL